MFYLSCRKKFDMRILIVAATEMEVGGLRSEVGRWKSEVGSRKSEIGGLETKVDSKISDLRPLTSDINMLITGVGMVATAFGLGKHLAANTYDLAINLGIAGSFDRGVALGDVVEISQDTFAELGAEDGDDFLPIDKLGFGIGTFYASAELADVNKRNDIPTLRDVNSITVNSVHGNEATIKKLVERLNPQLESMEGAAFFYACNQFNVPCMQIRAVSNYVEKRNRDNWQIGLAVKNLNNFALNLLQVVS